jgi:hypothetical protein
VDYWVVGYVGCSVRGQYGPRGCQLLGVLVGCAMVLLSYEGNSSCGG